MIKIVNNLILWKRNVGFRLKVFLTITITLWSSFALGIWLWARFADGLIKKQLGEKALAVVKTAAVRAETLGHHKLKRRADEKGAAYKAISNYLAEVKIQNPKIRYLYTARIRPDGKMIFVVDPEEEKDLNRDGIIQPNERKIGIGEIYEEPQSKYRECLAAAGGLPSISLDYVEDLWGVWMTAAAPLRDPEGKIEAILAADVSIDEVVNLQRRRKKFMLFFSMLLAVVAGGAVSWLIAHRITRPILEIELAARRISEGNFSRDLRLAGPAELGRLAKSFNDMRLKIYNDRERIARDLHDGVIQVIRAAIFQIEYLAKNPREFEQESRKLNETLDKAITEIRAVIMHLAPAKLIEKGLIPAMRYYAQKVKSSTGMGYEFTTNLPDNFSMPAEEEVIKIYLETLNNIKYNSDARHFDVVVRREQSSLRVEISDDGTGFDVNEALKKDDTFGLRNMFQRAKDNGWRLSIESAQGKGAKVRLFCDI